MPTKGARFTRALAGGFESGLQFNLQMAEAEKQNLTEQVKLYAEAMKMMKELGMEGSPQ